MDGGTTHDWISVKGRSFKTQEEAMLDDGVSQKCKCGNIYRTGDACCETCRTALLPKRKGALEFAHC